MRISSRRAESKGVLETRAYPDDKWAHLKEASILKKQRGLNALKDVQEKYVTLPQRVDRCHFEGGGPVSLIAQDAPGKTILLMGNEAIARGALEAGVKVCAAYPGKPLV